MRGSVMRRKLSTRDRERLLTKHGSVCHICLLTIHPGQRWEVSPPIPLAAGGSDDASNRAPAHFKCHRRVTRDIDIPLIAKVRRKRQKHNGSFRTSRHLPGGRDSTIKLKIGGGVVDAAQVRSECAELRAMGLNPSTI